MRTTLATPGRRQNRTLFAQLDWTVDGNARFGYWMARMQWTIGNDNGVWTVEAQVNSGPMRSKQFTTN